MSKKLEEYGAQKSATISCVKRMGEILGNDTITDAGLNAKYIISSKPTGTPVTEWVIPTIVFDIEPTLTRKLIKKWTGDNNLTDFSLKNILDWDYYKERFGNSILKIITIPAAMQGC